MARSGQRQKGARRAAAPKQPQRRVRHRGDIVSVLSRTVREVEDAAKRGRVTPAVRTKFQAAAPPPARSKELSSGLSSSQLPRRRGRAVLAGTAEKSGARNGLDS